MPSIGELSEAAILRRILPGFRAGPDVLVPPGDDAAVLRSGESVIVTTDSMVRGRDWRDDWSSARDVGAKVLAQNVADVAAMGGRCTGVLVALAADPATSLEWVAELTSGIADAAQDAGVSVVGGDLSSAPAGVVIVVVTAFGDLEGRAPVLRSGARVGDVVAVCGSLGRSGGGLSLYAAGAAPPTLTPESTAVDRARGLLMWVHRTAARPPYEAGPLAAQAGASALIDISDGLVRDASRVAEASGVTVELSRAALEREVDGPLRVALGDTEGLRQVLSGGEEHSLLATFAPGAVPRGAAVPWRVIGRVVDQDPSGALVTVDGVVPAVSGWDHFSG